MASKLFLTLPDKPFRCESCGRKFTYEPHLTEDGHWLCAVCGKEAVEQEQLNFSDFRQSVVPSFARPFIHVSYVSRENWGLAKDQSNRDSGPIEKTKKPTVKPTSDSKTLEPSS